MLGGLAVGDTIAIQIGAFPSAVVFTSTLTADLGVHPADAGTNTALLESFTFLGAGVITPGVSAITINGADSGAVVHTPIAGLPGTGLVPLGVDDVSAFVAPGVGGAAVLDAFDRLIPAVISPDVDLIERFVNLADNSAVIPTTLLFEVLSASASSDAQAAVTPLVNSPAVDAANAAFLGAAGGIEVALGTDGATDDRQNDDTTGGVGGTSAAQNILVSTGGVLVAGIPAWGDLIPFAIGAVKRIEVNGDPNDQVFSGIGRGDEVLGLLPPAVASTGLNTGATQFAYSDLTVRCRLYGAIVAAV